MSESTLKLELLKKHPNKYFVETGTARGEGIAVALEAGFENIISIEANGETFALACKRFIDFPQVVCVLGDSGIVLPDIIRGIKEPITFWLDAHWSTGESDLGPSVDKCPVLQDVAAIGQHPIKNHTILIDDTRYFRVGGIPAWNSVMLGDIMDQIMEINPLYRIGFANGFIANDVLVATVPKE